MGAQERIRRNKQKLKNESPQLNKANDIMLKIEKQTMFRVKQTIDRWRMALSAAEDAHNPRREELMRTYREVADDTQFTSTLELVVDKVSGADFAVFPEGKQDEDEAVTAKFNDEWFYEYIRYVVETEYYGHSLVQIDAIVNENIDSVTLIPREYVIPERGEYKKYPHDTRGESYLTPRLYKALIEVGRPNDLGKLTKLVPLILYKKFALAYWSEFQELFGTPFRIGKTKSTNPNDKQRMFDFLRNMGSAGFGIIGEGEEIEFIDNQRSDAHAIYLKMIEYADSSISKVMLGGTETVDSSNSGSQARATVHDEQSKIKTKSLLRKIEFHVNKHVIPKMQGLGLIPEGKYEFKFDNRERLTLAQQAELDAIISKIATEGQVDKQYLTETYGTKLTETGTSGLSNQD